MIASKFKAGVKHGSFRYDDVVVDVNGEVKIIDFSNASRDHVCRGRFKCEELRSAYEQLALDSITG